jgi:hypothetical protein
MSISTETLTASIDAVLSAARGIRVDVAAITVLADVDLLEVQRKLADARRAIDASASIAAGEIGYRSRRELGYRGLAQREGFRTPEALVQHETGTTARAALVLVQVGEMVHHPASTADSAVPSDSAALPWLAAIGAAVSAGTLSVDAAQAIDSGLGSLPAAGDAGAMQGGVTAEDLAAAAGVLLGEATEMDPDRLHRRARELRDDLDAAGIADRERQIYRERSIRRVRRANGVSRYIIDLDIESGAYWDDLYDKIASPRRGGVRFVDAESKAWAESVSNDERTTAQYMHDAITGLLRIGVTANTSDSRGIVGSRQPAVRVLVTADTLADRVGRGRIEGSPLPVSVQTVERIACESGTIAIQFDSRGNGLDLGRKERLFDKRQRIVLAARDGGCMFGDCDRPPSQCEAHHTQHWKRDAGETNIDLGILLCLYHHLLVHNNGWEIVRKDSAFWLIPPDDIDPNRTPRPMASKSAALGDLLQHDLGKAS